MEESNIMRSSYSNDPTQDGDLGDVNFDAFLNWEFSEAPEPWVVIQQNQVPAIPAEKKRRSIGATQPRIKRMRIQHSHICDVHQPVSCEPAVKCFGKWSEKGPYKGKRCERMVANFVNGQLPVCAQHRAQVNKMMRCEAVLECGLPCNEIVPWKAHGYPLCEAHWPKGKCYVMELPVEIRLNIYQYLIPDQPVQARRFGTRYLRQDRTPISTVIFRVNKAIHEEVADLFYGQTTFHVVVTNEQDRYTAATPGIFMCYAKELKTRMAASRTNPLCPTPQRIPATGIEYVFTPWSPSLSLRYFQRIRYFRINIRFDIPKKCPSASNSSRAVEIILAEAERNLLCDYLHQLVERLVTNNQASLRNLDISIFIQGLSDNDEARANSQAITHCQALINPIRRLRSHTASLVSLIRDGNGGREINMLPVHLQEDDSIKMFVQNCCAVLTDSVAPPPQSLVLVRFGQLTEIISQMSQYPFWRETDIEEMEILVSNGRSAREANDMKAMVSIFGDVFHKLNKYHSDHQDFMKRMKQSCEMVRSNGK